MKTAYPQDTIAAVATAPGRGGIGIVRVSGVDATTVAKAIGCRIPSPRVATFQVFYDDAHHSMDEGLVLFFKAPHSFTGEDVIEFQGHGGPVVLDQLLQACIKAGARMAKPGEFSERAFLNGKLDLAQAEAIADLIDAHSKQAAQSAVRSLQGVFSQKIQALNQKVIQLRMYVEAAIDFPEEEIDFLADEKIKQDLAEIKATVGAILLTAKQGVILRDGMTVVIAGKPNAGKSSLLNYLSKRDTAIVTDIEGTTRDVLREYIDIDGMPIHVIDTAGIRQAQNAVEEEGIKRTWQEIEKADLILWISDATKDPIQDSDAINEIKQLIYTHLPASIPITIVNNKMDLIENSEAQETHRDNLTILNVSVKENRGMTLLKNHLKNTMQFQSEQQSIFTARQRHLDALSRAKLHLEKADMQLSQHQAGELLAEDLRQAHHALGEVIGEFTSDDLLGEIFSSFCIGK